MLLAAFLALPVLDFGAISTRDQVSRLESGAVKTEKFDWSALAVDFGPSGLKALAELARSPRADRANLAKWALAAKNRWDLRDSGDGVDAKEAAFAAKRIEERVRVLPAGKAIPAELYTLLDQRGQCRTLACAAYVLADGRVALVSRASGVGFRSEEHTSELQSL